MSEKKSLHIEGMHCTACAEGIAKRLRKIGLDEVSVDFSSSSAFFRKPSEINDEKVISEIEALGYRASADKKSIDLPKLSLQAKFLICLTFTVPLLMHMFLPWHFLHNDKVQLALSIPVFTIGLFHFGRSAYRSLRAGVPNMDVLILIGSSAAFIYSLTGTIFNLGENFLFYESSASIITIVLFGNLLEKLSVRKTTTAIEELSRLQVIPAQRLVRSVGGNRVENISSTEIRTGDTLLVNEGDKIPTDGRIIEGKAEIDESMITGESMPVIRETGAAVVGGSLLVSGNITIEATAVGQTTVLSHIINLVRQAQTKKPDIQRLADTISAYFVPGVLAISLATVLIGYYIAGIPFSSALIQAIAVMVISCPCAMGLATPAAVMVGVGRAVRTGILIKEGKTLERLAAVKIMVFDKTGTLTDGQFRISQLKAIDVSQEFLENLLYSIEIRSSHPLAKAISSLLHKSGEVALKSVHEEKGLGLMAEDTEGNKYAVGSYRIASELTKDATHSVYVIMNEKLIGWLDLQDRPRPEAAELIANLKELGIEPVILSGDNEMKCRTLAEAVGIERYYAQKTPEQKLELIDQMQSEGLLAFVGDGINDAPALSKAGVGISLSSASQVAIQSAQLVLVGGRILQLAEAVRVSRKTLTVIKQNLFWAFIYNVFAIPIAAFGFLTPTVGALTMAFSDVVIIFNSLRLKIAKI